MLYFVCVFFVVGFVYWFLLRCLKFIFFSLLSILKGVLFVCMIRVDLEFMIFLRFWSWCINLKSFGVLLCVLEYNFVVWVLVLFCILVVFLWVVVMILVILRFVFECRIVVLWVFCVWKLVVILVCLVCIWLNIELMFFLGSDRCLKLIWLILILYLVWVDLVIEVRILDLMVLVWSFLGVVEMSVDRL